LLPPQRHSPLNPLHDVLVLAILHYAYSHVQSQHRGRAHGWYAKEVLPTKSTHNVHPSDRTMEIPPRSDITFNLPKIKSTRLRATETRIVDLRIASQGQTHRPNLRRGSAASRTFASAPSFTTASSTEASHKPQRPSWSSLATVILLATLLVVSTRKRPSCTCVDTSGNCTCNVLRTSGSARRRAGGHYSVFKLVESRQP
jgi:hypothetical protein